MNLRAFKKGLFILPLLLPVFAGAAVKFFNPLVYDSIPKKLSETGIYTNLPSGSKTMDTAVKFFEVNSALWSDAAHKDRWIILPPGTKVPYDDTTDVFAYPEGTIFVKLFSHDTILGNGSSRIYWETRLLVKKLSGENKLWHGFSYKWNAAGTEANLVGLETGLDTVLSVSGQNVRYRKWHFPTQGQCYDCHRQNPGTRGVLGFMPAQLKRLSKADPNKNQVIHLFDVGVFTGTQPTSTLGRRFRGMGEPIPTGLSADQRFRVIDTMARAYIAANCSGCHGTTGIADGALQHAMYLNYDYYNFTPQIEFGAPGNTGSQSLDLPDNDPSNDAIQPAGRKRMMMTLDEWGIDYSAGANFDMKRPWFPVGGTQRSPGLISAGYPSFSTGIFRQLARKTPRYDSLTLRDKFRTEGDPQGWAAWIFKAPWGSKAWLDTLRGRNVSLMTVLHATGLGSVTSFETASTESMPPLASYIPDTAALKILAEWARTYRTLVKVPGYDSVYVTGVKTVAKANVGVPSIRNGMLIVPEGWTGKAVMVSVNGRSWNLSTVGRGRYALPASTPKGVYVFRIGDKVFRTSLVR
jgi:hypothetical protein